ncbi:hypothetical protein [Pseudooctadecabacter sp.]|uniref:hypothetical protein n=1 Tax=Pseudooctadecabacter sp. TaxID=1966338 RepID=UPI0025E0FA14|nr:hypothetical protein [Pseudooctadecabacter sp.]
MSTVYVLIVVDVEGALASGDLASHVYLMDTTKYLGSGFEGTRELMTSLSVGDTIVWTAQPVDAGTEVTLVSISGQAVRDGVVTPVTDPVSPHSLMSPFQPAGGAASGTTYQYDMTLSLEGTHLRFDPFLVVA